MKKLFVLIFFASIGWENSFAQKVNGVPLSELDTEYVEVYFYRLSAFRNREVVCIDFGMNRRAISYNNDVLRTDSGSIINFERLLDAVNFLAKNGFELVSVYVTGFDGDIHRRNYVLRRKKAVE